MLPQFLDLHVKAHNLHTERFRHVTFWLRDAQIAFPGTIPGGSWLYCTREVLLVGGGGAVCGGRAFYATTKGVTLQWIILPTLHFQHLLPFPLPVFLRSFLRFTHQIIISFRMRIQFRIKLRLPHAVYAYYVPAVPLLGTSIHSYSYSIARDDDDHTPWDAILLVHFFGRSFILRRRCWMIDISPNPLNNFIMLSLSLF